MNGCHNSEYETRCGQFMAITHHRHHHHSHIISSIIIIYVVSAMNSDNWDCGSRCVQIVAIKILEAALKAVTT